MNEAFECARGDWYAHDAWLFADREAAYKFFFNAGAAAMREKCVEVILQEDAKCLNIHQRFSADNIADALRKVR